MLKWSEPHFSINGGGMYCKRYIYDGTGAESLANRNDIALNSSFNSRKRFESAFQDIG